MNWPTKSHSCTIPTPYEIFDLDRTSVYSKHKFYELVKIYHPDRHNLEDNPCSRDISHGERLERYRLIILANEILSDPTKRRAYDNHGLGWGSLGSTGDSSTQDRNGRKPYGRGPGFDESIFANATWEDWERWHARDTNETPQQSNAGNYINPNVFASLIVLMAVVSGVAQATRAGQYSGSLEDRAQAFTEERSRFMTDRAERQRIDTLNSNTRIKWFLEKRDPSKSGLKDKEEDVYKKHFSPPLLPAQGQKSFPDAAD